MNWEYKWIEAGTGALDQVAVNLNALGSVGWEVCGLTGTQETTRAFGGAAPETTLGAVTRGFGWG